MFEFGFISIFPILFTLVFILVFGIILFNVIKGIAQWNKNNHSPQLIVTATVVTKRTSVSHSHHQDANGVMFTDSHTTYYTTFQVESGDRIEFHIPASEFGMLAEGDIGTLTFQGTRYLSFIRK